MIIITLTPIVKKLVDPKIKMIVYVIKYLLQKWTIELCNKDSDGDGKTNGQELGDPNCVWVEGGIPEIVNDLSHPGEERPI